MEKIGSKYLYGSNRSEIKDLRNVISTIEEKFLFPPNNDLDLFGYYFSYNSELNNVQNKMKTFSAMFPLDYSLFENHKKYELFFKYNYNNQIMKQDVGIFFYNPFKPKIVFFDSFNINDSNEDFYYTYLKRDNDYFVSVEYFNPKFYSNVKNYSFPLDEIDYSTHKDVLKKNFPINALIVSRILTGDFRNIKNYSIR